MTTILAVEFSHQGFVWVTDDKDAGVKGLDLLLATLMGLDADGPAAAPVVTLPLEPLVKQYNTKISSHFLHRFVLKLKARTSPGLFLNTCLCYTRNHQRTVFEHLS